jgi:hypothetical protein
MCRTAPCSGVRQLNIIVESEMRNVAVYCADIGSVAKHRFGWAGVSELGEPAVESGTTMHELACAVANRLNEGRPVALGLECPLFVPITDDPSNLTCARPGEGARAWSAGAGAGALATGLTQTVWLLREIASRLTSEKSAYLDWPTFGHAQQGLFLWEAFVSGSSKTDSHIGDACLAVNAFIRALPDPDAKNAVSCSDVHSLIGAALIRAGWSTDPQLLSVPCIVIKA